MDSQYEYPPKARATLSEHEGLLAGRSWVKDEYAGDRGKLNVENWSSLKLRDR